jgi:GNAT superfamily N-acetyltransferase
MIKIREADHNLLGSYGEHLKHLCESDKLTRFGHVISDAGIDKLILDIVYHPENHHLWIATKNDETLGWGHLAVDHGLSWEVAVSVNRHQQGTGVGTQIVGTMLDWCKFHNVNEIYMHCMTENRAIQSIARKFKLRTVDRAGGQESAALQVPEPNLFETNINKYRETKQIMDNITELQKRLWRSISY